MPTDNAAIVLDFLAHWGRSADLLTSFDAYFTDATVWENVGVATTTGIAEAKAFVAAFPLAIDHIDVETLSIAVAPNGDVLTERVDTIFGGDGGVLATVRTMGIFEIADGRIVRFRDYFDSAALGG